MRLHMCQAYVCTEQDVVLCVGQASLPVSCCSCFVAGALRRSHTEGRLPPNPKGWTLAAARQTLGPTSGRPCRESPGLFVLSLSHSVDRAAWVVSPRRRASPALLNVSAADESTTAGGLKTASLNASAASESTSLPGGLEAFPLSELRWSREEPVSKPVTGLKMRALNSAGIRARSSPLLKLKNLRA